ncbi:DUF1493 family protein [Fulvivirga ligni]|uniref:DUF1493 family protein n=1 Tax=Fulvivirga ligni TaxID=2904246 RepID=UPI001F285CE9|nr:DUF1493 family protein [Fulvivirga ligni]UII18970.1 DUF1493 family protein [Fulvivirga ligni]
MKIKRVEYAKLRHAYATVKMFLEKTSGVRITSLNNTIAEDLGLWGDDNLFLLEEFVNRYELQHNGIEYEKYFHSEVEHLASTTILINILKLLIWLPLKLIEWLTLNKIKLSLSRFEKLERKVNDMTFKDLVTWYVEKDFMLSNQLKYELKSAQ